MKKIVFAILSLAAALSFGVTAYTTDLPIDITAIGRQEWTGSQVTTRIGANLFTADAQRVNEIFVEQIQRRQDTALYLFATVPLNYETNPHTQIKNSANDMALFSQPINFNHFTAPQSEEESLPLWLMVLVFAFCAAGGFIWAMVSKTRKRGRAEGVY